MVNNTDQHHAVTKRKAMMNRHLIIVLTALSVGLVACRRENIEAPDLDYSAATDNSRAEDIFTDMLAQVDKAVEDNGLRDLCDPTVTFDTTSTPRSITLDFGDVNCTATNGRLRRGRIRVTYTGRYRDAGTVITITPQGYHVNDQLIQGTKTVTNLGLNANGQPTFSVLVNGSVTAADGSWTSTHQAQRTRTWIEGNDTPALNDDVYLITGSGSGVNRNGVAYTTSITQALRVELACIWRLVSGTVVVTPEGRPVRTIDYGNGSCDGTVSITVNGQTFTITIG
jgi:hypothetical protein